MKDTSDRHRFKGAIYVGAAVSAVMALLPYVNKLFLTVYVLGPLAGVWFATRRSTKPLNFTEGAEIGFLSAFYGVIVASALYDIAWHFFHDKLWQLHNAYKLLPLSPAKGRTSQPHSNDISSCSR